MLFLPGDVSEADVEKLDAFVLDVFNDVFGGVKSHGGDSLRDVCRGSSRL